MKLFIKIFPPIISWVIFTAVIIQIPYPDSLIKADFMQISLFFFTLYLAITLTLNVFLKNYFLSGSVTLGLISLLLLKALDSLNSITSLLVIISIGLLVSYFRKTKTSSLTSAQKIPKLITLRRKK